MLEEAIASANAQTVPTEIIVVEDTDQHGPAWARNRGLERADTRYVAFLDADDLWEADKLERQLAKMKTQDVGLCVEGPDMDIDTFIRELFYGSLVSLTPSIVIDRDKVRARFSEDMDRYEDHFFMAEAASQGGVCLCENLVTVRKHEMGLSASGSSDLEYASLVELADRLERHPDLHVDANRFRQHVAYKYGRQLQRAGKWRKSFTFFWKSIQHGFHARTIAALLLMPHYALRLLVLPSEGRDRDA